MRGYRAAHHLASQQLVDHKQPAETTDGADNPQIHEPPINRERPPTSPPPSPFPLHGSHAQTLTSSRFPIPKLSTLPQRITSLLCLPRRRRKSSPSRPTHPTSSPLSSPPLPRPAFESLSRPQTRRYQSFPPPVFTGAGQPRALDSRLFPENLVDEYSYLGKEEERYWRGWPHSWEDVLAARKRNQVPHNFNTRNNNDDGRQQPQTPEQTPTHPAPTTLSLPLRLRGGAGTRRKLKDTDTLPPLTWWLAGGRGAPPTAGNYKKWREREKARIAEENKKRRRKEEGRGFWREVWWVLGGAKKAEYERRKKRNGCAGAGDAAGAV